MRVPEELVAYLFLCAVSAVYVTAAAMLIRSAVRRLLGRPARVAHPGGHRAGAWAQRTVFALAILGVLCFAYARFVEPYWLEVTHVRLPSPKLPEGRRPICIVHISDLHSDPETRLEERLPEVIARQRPDLIVFTGDAVNSAAGLPIFKRCMERLAAVAPTFAVRGNWDVWCWSDLDLFGGTGVKELIGEAVRTDVEGAELWLVGVPVGLEAGIDTALDRVPADAFTILLSHHPDEVERARKRRVDLYCAGHTHGGQVALPFYGALLPLSRSGKRYEAGLYEVGETWLYVNRGIGMERSSPRVRFCARPEVTVILLEPEE